MKNFLTIIGAALVLIWAIGDDRMDKETYLFRYSAELTPAQIAEVEAAPEEPLTRQHWMLGIGLLFLAPAGLSKIQAKRQR